MECYSYGLLKEILIVNGFENPFRVGRQFINYNLLSFFFILEKSANWKGVDPFDVDPDNPFDVDYSDDASEENPSVR